MFCNRCRGTGFRVPSDFLFVGDGVSFSPVSAHNHAGVQKPHCGRHSRKPSCSSLSVPVCIVPYLRWCGGPSRLSWHFYTVQAFTDFPSDRRYRPRNAGCRSRYGEPVSSFARAKGITATRLDQPLLPLAVFTVRWGGGGGGWVGGGGWGWASGILAGICRGRRGRALCFSASAREHPTPILVR